MLGLLALNSLNSTDITFFIVLAVIVALCVAVYFLIPVFNKKQYREQRENLKKREVAFKSNIKRTDGVDAVGDEATIDEAPEEAPADGHEESAIPTENEEK